MKKPNKPFEYALKLLGQRSYSEKKLSEKLRQREVEESEIHSIIAKLKSLGFIDDLKFAKTIVENSQSIRFNGRRKIYCQLLKKGISKDTAKKALDEAYANDNERETIQKLIIKFSKNISREKMYERLMRRLIARGFDYNLVKQEVSNFIKR